jgi:hypothetical protein
MPNRDDPIEIATLTRGSATEDIQRFFDAVDLLAKMDQRHWLDLMRDDEGAPYLVLSASGALDA